MEVAASAGGLLSVESLACIVMQSKWKNEDEGKTVFLLFRGNLLWCGVVIVSSLFVTRQKGVLFIGPRARCAVV